MMVCSMGDNVIVEADIISRRPYADVMIGDLPSQHALIDSDGSDICCLNANLITGMAKPVEKQIKISGLNLGQGRSG
jgi:hypothetical protein